MASENNDLESKSKWTESQKNMNLKSFRSFPLPQKESLIDIHKEVVRIDSWGNMSILDIGSEIEYYLHKTKNYKSYPSNTKPTELELNSYFVHLSEKEQSLLIEIDTILSHAFNENDLINDANFPKDGTDLDVNERYKNSIDVNNGPGIVFDKLDSDLLKLIESLRLTIKDRLVEKEQE